MAGRRGVPRKRRVTFVSFTSSPRSDSRARGKALALRIINGGLGVRAENARMLHMLRQDERKRRGEGWERAQRRQVLNGYISGMKARRSMGYDPAEHPRDFMGRWAHKGAGEPLRSYTSRTRVHRVHDGGVGRRFVTPVPVTSPVRPGKGSTWRGRGALGDAERAMRRLQWEQSLINRNGLRSTGIVPPQLRGRKRARGRV